MESSKRNALPRIFAVIVTALTICSCGNFKNIKVTSFNVSTVSFESFRSISGTAVIGISNPAATFEVSELSGTLHDTNGNDIAYLEGERTRIEGRTAKKYEVPFRLHIGKDVTLSDAMALVKGGFDECNYLVDISAKASINGSKTIPLALKDIPLKDIIDRVK